MGALDYAKLADELASLRSKLRKQASEAEHDEALGAVAAAEKAARQQNQSGVLTHLKTAGKWSFDIASKIGVSVAAKMIEQAMGL